MNTKEQQLIINHHGGPALVVAGPGCGKTQTLIMTIKFALEQGVKPSEILVLTYNKDTTLDFKARLHKVLGNKAHQINVKTFHSFGKSIVDEYWPTLGFNSNPLVETENYFPEPLIDRIATKYDITNKELKKTYTKYLYSSTNPELTDAVIELITEYKEFKQVNNIIDFNDMQDLPLKLFKVPQILSKVASRYRYFLVDELQDINGEQAKLICLLANNISTTVMVGDKKQMIYGFRNAGPEHWDYLVKKLAPTEYNLTQSFRCSQQDLPFINAVAIGDEKPLTSEQQGIKPELYVFPDVDDQADFLANRIHMLINDKGVKPSEIVCLARINKRLECLGLALESRGVPCFESKLVEGKYSSIIKGGFKLKRDLLRITKWVTHSKQHKVPEQAIRRLISVLRVDEIAQKVITEGWNSLYVPSNHPQYRQVLAIRKAVISAAQCTDIEQVIQILIDGIKPIINERFKPYKRPLLRDLSRIKGMARHSTWNNLKINAIQAPPTVSDEDEGVGLTTIHGAKGKEWKYVFLTHVVEGEIPFHGYTKSEQLEEERRLFYVAITRHSRKLCILQCPTTRVHFKNRGSYNKHVNEVLDGESSLITGVKKHLNIVHY